MLLEVLYVLYRIYCEEKSMRDLHFKYRISILYRAWLCTAARRCRSGLTRPYNHSISKSTDRYAWWATTPALILTYETTELNIGCNKHRQFLFKHFLSLSSVPRTAQRSRNVLYKQREVRTFLSIPYSNSEQEQRTNASHIIPLR